MTDTGISASTSGRLFVELSKYFLTEEYPSKLRQCLEVLPENALWARHDSCSNSIGNLLLHLTGNVRQWIVGGVAQRDVQRNRAAEFQAREGPDANTLMSQLDGVLRETAAVLDELSEADLSSPRFIQGRATTVLGAIYHVVEHFAMHTGQIVLLTKIHVPGAIRFYKDAGPLAEPLWKRMDYLTTRAR